MNPIQFGRTFYYPLGAIYDRTERGTVNYQIGQLVQQNPRAVADEWIHSYRPETRAIETTNDSVGKAFETTLINYFLAVRQRHSDFIVQATID